MITTRRALQWERTADRAGTAVSWPTRIRPAAPADFPAMLRILRRVSAAGDSCVLSPALSATEAAFSWFGSAKSTWVAEEDGRVVGMYRLDENQPGRGSHVATASLLVDPAARGQGVGRALGQHCLVEAKADGFVAMQFNLVASTDARAIALLKKLGFAVVGTLPRAFRHELLGPVDAYVLHRFLYDRG
jgi:L-amino acid N-acyltransferase YncA